MIFLYIVSLFLSILTGLFGFDTGILLLPFLLQYGFSMSQSVGTLLFLNTIPNTLPALMVYIKKGECVWKPTLIIAGVTIIGIFIGSVIGTGKHVKDRTLLQGYTICIFIIAIYMFYRYFIIK